MKLLNRTRELWEYRDLVRNLVLRDLKVRYRNSILGVAWSWANPLLMMLVLTVVFNLLAGQSQLQDFHVFVLSALLPWNFFSSSVSRATPSIVENANLVKKTYFPREVLPISIVVADLVNFLIALPVFFGLALVSGASLSWCILLLPLTITLQLAFTVGLTLVLSTLDVFYRDTQIILGVALQAWFFLTPIIYPISTVPEELTVLGVTLNAQLWLRRLNPMASMVASYRDLLYWGVPTGIDFFVRTAITALVVLVLGYLVFLRYSPRFGEEV
jgi:lipopolysaccharide transport system permease protein